MSVQAGKTFCLQLLASLFSGLEERKVCSGRKNLLLTTTCFSLFRPDRRNCLFRPENASAYNYLHLSFPAWKKEMSVQAGNNSRLRLLASPFSGLIERIVCSSRKNLPHAATCFSFFRLGRKKSLFRPEKPSACSYLHLSFPAWKKEKSVQAVPLRSRLVQH